MKTSELHGAALDWAVAQCEGADFFALMGWDDDRLCYLTEWGEDFEPSVNWQQAGRIIEREEISIVREFSSNEVQWAAWMPAAVRDDSEAFGYGPTALVAAIRCYVTSKLGDEVEVPSDLKQGERK
jgi:hypothetical protein